VTTNTSSDIGSATQTVGGYITSITGTTNQITASASTGAVVLSVPNNIWLYAKLTPSASQMKNLIASPFVLVAAAGAHTIINIYAMLVENIADGTAYSGTSSAFFNVVFTGAVPVMIGADSAVPQNASACIGIYRTLNLNINCAPLSTSVNKDLVLTLDTDDFTAGTDTINFYIWYSISSTQI
jgi:hypothetical protein